MPTMLLDAVVNNATTGEFISKMGEAITLDNLMGALVAIAPILVVAVIYSITKNSSKKAIKGVTKGKVNY